MIFRRRPDAGNLLVAVTVARLTTRLKAVVASDPSHEINLGFTNSNTIPQARAIAPTIGGMKWVWVVST